MLDYGFFAHESPGGGAFWRRIEQYYPECRLSTLARGGDDLVGLTRRRRSDSGAGLAQQSAAQADPPGSGVAGARRVGIPCRPWRPSRMVRSGIRLAGTRDEPVDIIKRPVGRNRRRSGERRQGRVGVRHLSPAGYYRPLRAGPVTRRVDPDGASRVARVAPKLENPHRQRACRASGQPIVRGSRARMRRTGSRSAYRRLKLDRSAACSGITRAS